MSKRGVLTFGRDPLWEGQYKESLLCVGGTLEVHLRLLYKHLSDRGAFELIIMAFERSWTKKIEKACDFF